MLRQAAFKRFNTAPAADQGEEISEHLSTGDYGSVKSLMTFSCSRALTRKKVVGVWEQVVAGTGRCESCSNTTIQTADGTNVVAQKLNQYLGGGLTQANNLPF
ncbi:hypothetical protein ACX80E_12335 [Arthrobacter sp. TMN-49]